MTIARSLLAALICCLAVSLPPSTEPASAQAQGRPALLGSARGAPRDRVHKGPSPRRSRIAALRLEALAAADGRAAPPAIDLNLFDDVTLVARVDQFESRGPASFLWKGRLDGVPQGHATFVATDGIVAGTVFGDGVAYEVGYAGDGVYEVRELDPSAFPTDDPPSQADLNPPADAASPGEVSGAPPVADSASQIDVLVVWTPAAETAAGGASAMRSLVDLAVANANTAYANSGIATRLRLVYKTQVSYAESSSISTDLSRLVSPGDGYIDTVHALRDTYGADIVSLLGSGYTSTSGACGIGYLMSYVSTSFASSAFNVVDYSCAAGNLSYAHEVGHNEGMHHDPANAGSIGAYSYSYGYVDPGCAFRTVMAYGGCPRVTQFSNPNVTYSGRVTGSATQNNALTLSNTAATVANFRQAVSTTCAYGLSASSWSAPAAGGSSSVGVIVTGSGCSWTATSSAAWLTITSGASGTASGTVGFTAAANTSSSARSATLTVAGQTFTVTQAGATCSYTVTTSMLSLGSGGGAVNVTVSSPAGCGWTAGSSAAWLALTSGPNGSGNGTATFTAAANTTATARSATMTIAGKSFTVSEAGAPCTYAFSPTSVAPGAAGGSYIATLSSVTGCGWTAASSAAWLTVTSGSSGTGSGTVAFTVAANATASPRSATITAGGTSLTVTQPGIACSYTVTPASLNLSAAGGAYTVAVSAGAGCGWTASSGVSWTTVSSGASGSGNGTVGVTVAPNLSTSASRTGTVTIAGKTLTVSQAIAPSVLVRSLTASRTYPIPTGSATTWTAMAAGGAVPLEYKFWRYSVATATWIAVRDYAPGNTWSWTPDASAAGSYAIQVWVRQVGSTVKWDAWKSTGTFQVTAPAAPAPITVTSIRANMTFPKPAGTTVTWTATASGGSGPLEYQFWVYNGTWSLGRAYSTSNQFAWTPTIAGPYALQVWVRQVGTTVKYAAWLSSGTVSITAPSNDGVTTVTLALDRSLPVRSGTRITWTATANGTTPEYQFWVYDGTRWSILQSYGSTRTCAWTPAAPGTYALQVWARRAGSQASYEAWAGSGTFSVTP